tara:strand:+ start:324 stop:836 length:513 start_codon:yes stop_codon:yes gene_type:complete
MSVKSLDFSPFHPKNIALQDFEEQNKIKKELEVRVREWTEQYCDAITENYRLNHIDSLKRNLSGDYPEYAQQQLDEMEDGSANLMKFRIQEGRKYYKIIQQNYDTFQDRNEYRDGSVHSFVDKNTGEVYMAASWSKPAKHVRFDMRVIRERTLMHTPSFVTWTSGYLYLR